jgi:glutamyl-tRNA reductase
MQLTPDQINDFLSKAILDSQIGEAVKESVRRVLDELKKTYQNPFDAVIKKHIEDLIDAELRSTYRPIFEEKVKTAMAEWATNEAFDKIIQAATEQLRSRY